MMQAAEQIFRTKHDGFSSLLWLDHPKRPLIFLVHYTGRWRAWPDTWDGRVYVLGINGAERGFAYHLHHLKDSGWNLDEHIGFAIRPEVSYDAGVEELTDPGEDLGWRITDSWGRKLRLKAPTAEGEGMWWSVEEWSE
jgi:hypothetical protein